MVSGWGGGYGGEGSRLLLEAEDLVHDAGGVAVDVGVGDFDDGGVEAELLVLGDDFLEGLFGHDDT